MEEKKNLSEEQKKSKNGILFNLVIPILCLLLLPNLLRKISAVFNIESTWLSEPKEAGKIALVIALSFPIISFIYYYKKTGKTSFISVIGFIGILITGIIGLLELPPEYVAYERAAIPLLLAISILATNYTKSPLVKKFFYNPSIFDTEKIDKLIEENGTGKEFNITLKNTSYLIALSFVISSICNYIITRYYMTGDNVDYTASLGKVKLISLLVTFVPLLIIIVVSMLYFQKRLKEHTGVSDSEELYNENIKNK